jgi:hypothetical protein
VGQSEARATEPDQWKEDGCNMSSPTLPETNGQGIW